jgi:outer membrane protein with beta-barrel domain
MRLRVAATTLSAMFALMPISASAQTSRAWEIFGGYSYLQDSPDRTDLPAGFAIGAALGINRWLSAVVDVSRNTHTVLDNDLRTYAILAGARASARIGRFLEFGQLVAGRAHASSTVVGVTSGDSGFALQPGAGLDYPVGRAFSGRLQVDFRSITGGGFGKDPRHDFRFVAAVVYRHQL